MMGLKLEGVQKRLEELAGREAESPLEVSREDNEFDILRAWLNLSNGKPGLNSCGNTATLLEPLDFLNGDVGAFLAPTLLQLLLLGDLHLHSLDPLFLFHLGGDQFGVRHRDGRERLRSGATYAGSAKEANTKLALSASLLEPVQWRQEKYYLQWQLGSIWWRQRKVTTSGNSA